MGARARSTGILTIFVMDVYTQLNPSCPHGVNGDQACKNGCKFGISCAACTAGKYKNIQKAALAPVRRLCCRTLHCKQYPRHSDGSGVSTGATACNVCPAGRYNTQGDSSCASCAAGKYVAVTCINQASDCIACVARMSQWQAATKPRTVSTMIVVGKYVVVTGSNRASDCIACQR
jgi:hypothetical protein